MNTNKIDLESLQILTEGSWVKLEKDKRKDTISSEDDLSEENPDSTKKIEISLRPNKLAMDALVKYLRQNYVSYWLSPLIQLFLEKKDRLEILITALQPDALFCIQSENLPFLTKESAFDYLIKKYWSDIFEKEVIPLNPIRGNFVSINRCGITNILLGPPNYHLYNDLIKEHYNQHLAKDYSWESFMRQIKNEHDPSLIKQWQKGMSEHVIFRLKENPQVCFDSYHMAQKYLQDRPYLLKESVKRCTALSLSFAEIENIQDEVLKKQIYQKIKDETRSPISLGCFCRMRFRHAGLHLYRKKRGNVHVAFLSPIKRKVRTENDNSLSPELARIVDFIEQNPMINIATCVANFCSALLPPESPKSSITQENIFKGNLIRLIKTGYVVQFEDGSLYVSPKHIVSVKKVVNK